VPNDDDDDDSSILFLLCSDVQISFLRSLSSNTLGLCVYINIRGNILHPYKKKTGKFTVFYILMLLMSHQRNVGHRNIKVINKSLKNLIRLNV
jgi:hypothetical protein